MILIENPSGRATVAESCDLTVNAGLIIKQKNIGDAWLTDQADALSGIGEQMSTSIATDRSKPKTEELADKDGLRDDLLSALKSLLRGYMKWNHNGYPDQAEKVYRLVRKHGLNMTWKNYEEESALLESLLKDLEQPAIAEALTALSLTELIGDLKNAQAAFSETYRKATELEAGKDPVTAATILKKDARKLLSQVASYLNVMATTNEPVYGALAAEMAELVNSLNQKIRARSN